MKAKRKPAASWIARLPMFFIILSLLLLPFLLPAGCSKSRPVYRDSSKVIKVDADQEFDIVLKSNASTGYHWQLAKPLDKDILKLVKSEYKEPENVAPGGGGEEVWTFQGVKRGKTTISLEYVRSWEKDKPPAKTDVFGVLVR